MALRGRPITWKPRGLSDAIDGTNTFPGAMQSLQNLVPAPHTRNLFVPRPASTLLYDFSDFTTPSQGEALLDVGSRSYGFIQTARFAGKSEPFIFDQATNAIVAISGVTSANTPTSTSNTGDWTPPTAAQFGGRVLFTHPGFDGVNNFFGWLDMTGGSLSLVVDDTSGSAVLGGSVALIGAQVGWTLTGTGIPAGTRVKSTANFVLTESGTTHSNTTLDGLASTTGLATGMAVAGGGTLGIPAGTTIAAVTGPASVTLSQAATASATASVTFTGAQITMTANATGTHAGITVAAAGGTTGAPLWCAGNTNFNPLPAVPVAVAQYSGEAWFAVANTVVFSDSGAPIQVSNNPNIQTLTFQNGIDVTALAGLPLSNQLGGIIQSLMVFQGHANIQQITGDPFTPSSFAVNTLNEAIGTDAPGTIAPTPQGLMFIAPDGLRLIDFQGHVSPPLGLNGDGIAVPFINAVNPSRMRAAYNEDTYRVSVKGNLTAGDQVLPNVVTQEFWYSLKLQAWSGPHTFPASLISPSETSLTFTMFSPTAAGLWTSPSLPTINDTYVENGTQLVCRYQTVLLPDNAEMAENELIEATISLGLPSGLDATVSFLNELAAALDTVTVSGMGALGAAFGTAIFGVSIFGGTPSIYIQRRLAWHIPIVFKQGSIVVSVNAQSGLVVGNLYMRYHALGYMLQGTANAI